MIPVFNCTEEALDYGKIMSADMVDVFLKENQRHYEMSKALRLEGKWNESMEIAVKGQFYREAVESFHGKANRRRK